MSGWRCQQRARAGQGLTALDQRLRMELASTIGAVRTCAAELPGLDLAVPETDRQLAVDWQFPGRTVVGADPPWPVLRPGYRVFPGEPGRRRARQHLRDQIPDLTAAYLEEANAAVQQELTQLSRTLAGAMEQRYADAREAIRAARRTAAGLGERAAAEAACTDSKLDKQEQALRRVALLLRALGSGDPVPGPRACWLDRWREDRQTQPWRWGSPGTRRQPLTVPGFW